MRRTVTTSGCTIAVAAAVLALGALSSAAPAPAHPRARPDLVERGLGNPPARLVPGGAFTLRDTTLNRGQTRSPGSSTRYYLRHGRVMRLVGARRVPRLAAHRASRGRVVLRAPPSASAGSYSLLACTDATRRVRESDERNNCATARVRVTIGRITTGGGPLPPGAVDSDHDGFPDNLDCAPHDASIHPGAADAPDLGFVDSNCDGIDGNASRAVFVSPIGHDTNPGTEAAPKRTFAAALGAADSQRKAVYATFGTYREELDLSRGMSVYGGYTNSWARSLANATRVTGTATASGDTEAAVATDVTTPTTLQLLTLAPSAPTTAGASSYGLRGLNSPGLRLEHVTVLAAAGTAGPAGMRGTDGLPGGNGGKPYQLYTWSGGTSPVGHSGGNGASGGSHRFTDPSGVPGDPGLASTPDAQGRIGGAGGAGGDGGSAHTAGGRGAPGDFGTFVGNGAGGPSGNADATSLALWRSQNGQDGNPGSDGHGGGGGGGGGADDCVSCSDFGGNGGGGGGGGQGGGGGGGGRGGGGSFGIFLVDSSGASVHDSTILAANGGAGGAGGAGGFGGQGGAGGAGRAGDSSDASDGGNGGPGGIGGGGGDGGGGAGGPSAAIFGLAPANVARTTLSHGEAGPGGAGPSQGADGTAADYLI